MFYSFLYPLVKYVTFFNIFQYITFRAAYAAVTALLISFLAGPYLIRKLKAVNAGQTIRDDGPKTHLRKAGTPTMGGILIISSVVLSVLLWQDISNFYTWILLLAAVGFGAIGFADDFLKITRKNSVGLSASLKFVAQLVLSLAIVLLLLSRKNGHTTQLYIPVIKNPIVDLSYLYVPFAVLLLVGYSNAVNITDGCDGLAIGLVIMVGLVLGILSYVTGRADWADYLQIPFVQQSWELAVFCLALVGASVGFLWFNSHPAQIMMGDTGSLALGGVLGTIALIVKKEILLLMIGGVFAVELASVLIQVISFRLRNKRVFRMAPLHHHFELLGWPESKVVIRFWILGGLFAILSLSTLKLR